MPPAGRRDLGQVILLAEDTRRHVGRAHADRRELESTTWVFLEGDSRRRDRLDRAFNFLNRRGEAAVLHADDGVAGLLHAIENLLVLDLKLGVVRSFLRDLLSEDVVLARIGCDIGEDGQLVDVRIVFRAQALQLWMDCFVTGRME